MGDISSRRGRVQGTARPRPRAGRSRPQVPMAEMLEYANALTSLTGGKGAFHMEFSHYDEVPAHVRDKIIAEAKRRPGSERPAGRATGPDGAGPRPADRGGAGRWKRAAEDPARALAAGGEVRAPRRAGRGAPPRRARRAAAAAGRARDRAVRADARPRRRGEDDARARASRGCPTPSATPCSRARAPRRCSASSRTPRASDEARIEQHRAQPGHRRPHVRLPRRACPTGAWSRSSRTTRRACCAAREIVEALGDNPLTGRSTIDRILAFLGLERRAAETTTTTPRRRARPEDDHRRGGARRAARAARRRRQRRSPPS